MIKKIKLYENFKNLVYLMNKKPYNPSNPFHCYDTVCIISSFLFEDECKSS